MTGGEQTQANLLLTEEPFHLVRAGVTHIVEVGPDSALMFAILKKYAPSIAPQAFAQMGFLDAKFATNALLSIKGAITKTSSGVHVDMYPPVVPFEATCVVAAARFVWFCDNHWAYAPNPDPPDRLLRMDTVTYAIEPFPVPRIGVFMNKAKTWSGMPTKVFISTMKSRRIAH